jgi:hypothetical protein
MFNVLYFYINNLHVFIIIIIIIIIPELYPAFYWRDPVQHTRN